MGEGRLSAVVGAGPTLTLMAVDRTVKGTLPNSPGASSGMWSGWWTVGQLPVLFLEDLAQYQHQQRCAEEWNIWRQECQLVPASLTSPGSFP